MAWDNAYSRLVAGLKILLPLAALGVLATLFLFQQHIDPSRAIPFATVDVEALARDAGIGAPTYAGVTEDGTAVTLTAATARPDPADPRRLSAQEIAAVLESPDGARTDVTAAAGRIDGPGDLLELSGGVTIVTSTGYRLTTERLQAALDRTHVRSDTPVAAEGPPGRIAAGGMELTEAEGGGYELVFTGGVKLLYDPQAAPPPP